MSIVRFTTNPAEYDDVAGLVIHEQNPPGFIQGKDVFTVGIAGETLRGPVDTPTLITGKARFTEIFGLRANAAGGATINKVRDALLNKRFGKLYICRAAAADAVAAEMDFVETATPIINIAASSVGSWGNDVTAAIEAATDGNANHFNIVLTYRGETKLIENADVSATGNNNLATVYPSDVANWVTITKLADGRPDNATAAALTDTAGSDGTIVATDYTAANRAVDKISGQKGVNVVLLAEYASAFAATIKAAVKVKADASFDRVFLLWSGTHADSAATVITDVASYRSDRIVYCHNSPTILDPDTDTLIEVPPDAFVASIISQQDVNKHIGRFATQKLTGAIRSLRNESFNPTDYANFRAAGITAWEKDEGGGFNVVDGVVSLLTKGKTEYARRQSADFIQLSLADEMKYLVKEENTEEFREDVLGLVTGFLGELKAANRVVQDYKVEQDSVNTQAQRDQGIEVILIQVKLIGHARSIVVKTTIGETVNIEVAA